MIKEERDIIKQLELDIMMYSIRKTENIDMQLRIEEIKDGYNFNGIGYEQKVQSSKSCPDNLRTLEEIEQLERAIKRNVAINKKIDNWINIPKRILEKNVIKLLLIEHRSFAEVQEIIDRGRKQVYTIKINALRQIMIKNNEITHKLPINYPQTTHKLPC